MSRLFITQREIDFISDLTKEVIKDVAGQKIYFYRVREDLSEVHNIYEESPDKIFDPPVELECLIEWQPSEIKTNQFGSELLKTINVYLHSRDLLDRNIDFREGDYFSHGSIFFEATSVIYDKLAFGHTERPVSLKVVGKQARVGQIAKLPIGPTSEEYSDADAIQTTFVQQRGLEENRLGKTGDIRQLQKDGKLEPFSGTPTEISPTGDDSGTGSSFYDGE